MQRVELPSESGAFPFGETRAARLLHEGLIRAKTERRLSARQIALGLGYKQPVVLSHMASGRVAVPLERAIDIAEAVGLRPDAFLSAALEQREPRASMLLSAAGNGDTQDRFARELAALAGGALASLPDEHKQVLREVVVDRAPSRRWLTLAELPTVACIRSAAPRFSTHGLSATELNGISAILELDDI